MYKTQLPMVIKYYPEYGSKIVKNIITVMDHHGHFPSGYQKWDADGLNKFNDQCTGVAWVVLGYAYNHKDKLDGVDWDQALKNAANFEKLDRVQQILKNGSTGDRSLTHVLDVTSAFNAICYIAKGEGKDEIYTRCAPYREIWKKVYDPNTGLLIAQGKYYEGTHWNYSFRPHYAMEDRVKLAGGKEKFADLLDEFFGFKDIESGNVTPNPGDRFQRRRRRQRFEGLNNECDMEAPLAYLWSSKPERAQQVIDAVMKYQFQPGMYGLPGNNDSGGTSSWYVLNAIKDFPAVEVFEK